MKKIFFGALAFSLAAGMVSCSNEEIASPVADGGKTVRMSVNISRPGFDAETRTQLTEVEGNLDCVWSEGDQVVVTNANGTTLGTLTISTGAGTSNATFDGTLTGVNDGTQNLNFFYLGNKNEFPAEFDYSNQSGELAALSAQDFLTATTEVSVEEGSAYAKDMGLARYISFAHFTLSFPEGVTSDASNVTVSGSHFYNKIAVSGTREFTLTEDAVTVAKDDMYIVIVPSKDGEATDLTFSKTIDGIEYECKLDERVWENSEFVRESQGKGIEVVMMPVENYSYNVNYDPNKDDGSFSTECVAYHFRPSKFEFTVGDKASKPTWEGHEFLGWSDSANGTKDLTGTKVTLTKDNTLVTYYAIWKFVGYEYKLHFDANKPAEAKGDVSNVPGDVKVTDKGESYTFTLTNTQKPTLAGYEFIGWSASKDAKVGQESVTVSKDSGEITVYAVWNKKSLGGGVPDVPGGGYNK